MHVRVGQIQNASPEKHVWSNLQVSVRLWENTVIFFSNVCYFVCYKNLISKKKGNSVTHHAIHINNYILIIMILASIC